MVDKPQIESLSYKRRQYLFLFLVFIFLLSFPVMIFYTAGYRLDFTDENQTIVPTGGIYITTNNLLVDVFVNEKQIEKPRLFRSAYYIQNLVAGQHRVVVQRPDLHTWVKELPVDAHIVVEVLAFNLPIIPQLRPITEYVTATGTPVYVAGEESADPLVLGSSTIPVFHATTTLDSSYTLNTEYAYMQSLFGTTTDPLRSVFIADSIHEKGKFTFSTTSPARANNRATTTGEAIVRGGMQLIVQENDLYAVWTRDASSIPYYFCVPVASTSTIAQRYGDHVAQEIERLRVSTTTPLITDGNRMCRPELKINRLRQDIYFYDFFPGSTDLILLQLEDGLYVTEIDDRAWQNTQLLYPGDNFRVVVQSNAIFIKDGGRYFEIVTAID